MLFCLLEEPQFLQPKFQLFKHESLFFFPLLLVTFGLLDPDCESGAGGNCLNLDPKILFTLVFFPAFFHRHSVPTNFHRFELAMGSCLIKYMSTADKFC
jgi:hypothetical protein